ncbi:hypothetical protein V1264_001983 [Littorina saxatilis]|uniref:HTH OST-type domain-containing protein n=1 Tax=Littorina saxatilis TaxID=31220 RepID=A0AAN9C2L8_9CAEN
MEIPENIRIKILTVLLSIGQNRGVTLDCFDRLYQEAMQEPVRYQALGYSSLLEFFRAVPDVGLEYDEEDEAWKVYGTPRPTRITLTEQRRQTLMMDAQHDTQPRTVTLQRRLRKDSFGVDAVSVCSTEPDPDHVPIDVDKLVLVPDDRGQYSICFPRSKRPSDWNVNLFSLIIVLEWCDW